MNFIPTAEYGDFSHALFNTTGDTFEGHFIAGDAFGPAILSVIPPCQQPPSLRPKLSNLTSLNPLHGHCAVINAANFFHLFDEEKQLHMARALAGLLSPEPGSVICGRNLAASKKGEAINQLGGRHCSHFCHSPESWVDLWDGLVFEKGKVKVEAELYSREHLNYRTTNMVWSITRL